VHAGEEDHARSGWTTLSNMAMWDGQAECANAVDELQETLIVWSEGDNCDYALSFQEKKGCDEVWEKICQVVSATVYILIFLT